MCSAQRDNFGYFTRDFRGQTAITKRISKAGERNLSLEEAAPVTGKAYSLQLFKKQA